jgi:flagellar hook-associated protein 2
MVSTTSINGTTSVGGLAGPLDTNALITQLMQAEAQPQTKLKATVTTEQTNIAFAALATTARGLSSASAWNPVTATSSSTLVSVTAGANAVSGPLSFTVNNAATAQSLLFTNTVAPTATVTTGSTKILLTHADGSTQQIDTGNGTLQGMLNAISASGTGLKATTVTLDDGSRRVQVSSVATGASSDFTLTNLDGSALLGGAGVTAGQDAAITIGRDTVHSASNTFTNVANGLTLTIDPTIAANTAVTVNASQDATGMTAKVQAMMEAINAALTQTGQLSGFDTTTSTAGPLANDNSVSGLSDRLLNAALPTNGTSLASVGVQLDRYGDVVFDAAAFTAAYKADPVGTAAKFTDPTNGFATRIQAAATAASDPATGTLTASITSRSSNVKEMQTEIASWDVRLALRQNTLTTQFTNMQTLLQQLNSQSSWLSSQLGTTSSSNSNSSTSG